MIGYLRGRVTHLLPEFCLLDVNGVGYRVFVAGATRSRLIQGEQAELFIHTAVSENAIVLFGFSTAEEYSFFQQLIGVSGIGPRSAQAMLGASTVEAICRGIVNKQVNILTKLPGVGKKTAERMILELKDKISLNTSAEELTAEDIGGTTDVGSDVLSETLAALTSLGYSESEIMPVVKRVGTKSTTEALIKAVLKEFAKG